MRRHHNKTGLRQIKRGRTRTQVEHIAARVLGSEYMDSRDDADADNIPHMSLYEAERSSALEAVGVLFTALGWTSGGLGSAALEIVRQRDLWKQRYRELHDYEFDYGMGSVEEFKKWREEA